MARLGETNSSSSQGNSSSSTVGTQDAQIQRKIVGVGDSIIRKVDRAICCHDRMYRTVCCLPGARVRHIADRVDRLLGGGWDLPGGLVTCWHQ
ncbi:hypothetical protein FKM82_008668 [Ascaphus truei]